MDGERARVARLARRFAPAPAGVEVGIGDDAAVLASHAGRALVWTVDTAVEGVHFRRAWLTLVDLGWRSFMAAASDLAAMGATPRGALSSLILPADLGDDALDALAEGQNEAARALGTAVVGGNLARGGELSITTTLLGEAERPLCRDGAKPGDVIALAGAVGLARAGLVALERGLADDARVAAAVAAWRRPLARLAEGQVAAGFARAALDLSDGLALDASRLADASGVGVELDLRALLAHAPPGLRDACAALDLDPLETMLTGGEDYALLVAAPAERVLAPFVVVGRVVEGRGLSTLSPEGEVRPLRPRGWDHFG